MLKFSELFISFVCFPFCVLTFGYLEDVFGVWFLAVLGLFYDVLADSDVQGVVRWGWGLLQVALVDVGGEGGGWDQFGTVRTFHGVAIFQDLPEVSKPAVLLLEHPIPLLHFL